MKSLTDIDFEIKPVDLDILMSVVKMIVRGYAKEYPGLHEYDEEATFRSLYGLLNREDFLFTYYTDSKQLLGAFCGRAIESPFSGKMEGVEQFWYIKPEFRKMGLGATMVSQFAVWAKKKGCTALKMSYVDVPGTGYKMERFLNAKGFRTQNMTMIKTLE